LVLLYFPLGFCLAVWSRSDGRRWLPVALIALAIAAPVEYLQGWIVGRFPDASDVAVSLGGALTGAWMGPAGFVQPPGNRLTTSGNSADKTDL
jgi:VanZ family protein